MEQPLFILTAFLLGFAVTRIGLPPLVGYLIAGFFLNLYGVTGSEAIEKIADTGVTLLLFTIGLKLDIRSLLKPVIWAVATMHMAATVMVLTICCYGLLLLGLPLFSDLDLASSALIAFGFSFSSTVFAVKVLENRGEMGARHGKLAIGILIMQDIFAVVFMTFSTGKIPSAWALAVVPALFIMRPLLMMFMDRCGHRELLLLLAMFMSLGIGAGGFDMVGLKADLGALILGVLVAGHPKAEELSKTLLSFKDLFLVGFFVNIGLTGIPTLQTFGIACLFSTALLLKASLFFFLFMRFHLRVRTATYTTLALFNYSEFGLLVAFIGVRSGWIGNEWLVVMALALSISFILASPLNAAVQTIYARYAMRMKRFESDRLHPDDQPISTGDACVIIFGMGRVGAAAYDTLQKQYGDRVLGIDYDRSVVDRHLQKGRNVIHNDATDPDFWEKLRSISSVRIVLLAMSAHSANIFAAQAFAGSDFTGMVAATARHEDQTQELEDLGVPLVFNFYEDAGVGFADRVMALTR